MRYSQRTRAKQFAFTLGLGLACVPLAAFADDGSSSVSANTPLVFVNHGTAYAAETQNGVELDPHVFVADSNAPDTTGPEGIHHIGGIRPARVADDPELPLENAQGDALNLSLGHWLATRATANFVQDDGNMLSVHFTHLVPFGVYSLFVTHNTGGDDGGQYSYRPLKTADGGVSFTAPGDGALHAAFPLDHMLSNREAVILVYHSDDTDHDNSPGDIGVNAHVQLVLTAGGNTANTTTDGPSSTTDDGDRNGGPPADAGPGPQGPSNNDGPAAGPPPNGNGGPPVQRDGDDGPPPQNTDDGMNGPPGPNAP